MLEMGQLLLAAMAGLIVGIAITYAVARVVTVAYFRSRMEYDQFVMRVKLNKNIDRLNQLEGVS